MINDYDKDAARIEIAEINKIDEQHKQAIIDAGVMTEAEMREAEVPWFNTIEELSKYINDLATRPHSYGTCVYAMSHAAVAAFNFVARKLGVTGFQSSMADLDILKHTRSFKFGKLVNYENLLYPQYLNSEHFPGVDDLLSDPEIRACLKNLAQEKLRESDSAHPNVLAHWEMLAAWEDENEKEGENENDNTI